MRMYAALVGVVVLTGCATGFDRGAIQQRLVGQEKQVDDAAIREALEKRPQVRFPIKVAVHMVAETYEPRSRHPSSTIQWRWSADDRELIEKWANSLRKSGIVSDMFIMSDLVTEGNDPKSIRLAAAKHGADAVLLIKGVVQVDSYVNPASVLNLLIVPGWFVPGSNRDVLLVMKGAMWDVANQYLYLGVDAEADIAKKGPTFTMKSEDVIDEAKHKALADFGTELMVRLHALKGAEETL